MTDHEHLSEESLQRYVDGTADRPDLLLRHLESCPVCRGMIRRQATLHEALRKHLPLAAPRRFTESVLREIRLAKRFEATTRIAGFFAMLFAGVSTLSALGGIYWLSTSFPSSRSGGTVGEVLQRADEWLGAVKEGVNSILGSLTAGLLSGHQFVVTLAAVALASAALVFLDLFLGKRFVRRMRI